VIILKLILNISMAITIGMKVHPYTGIPLYLFLTIFFTAAMYMSLLMKEILTQSTLRVKHINSGPDSRDFGVIRMIGLINMFIQITLT
jgi:hypothetical protein